MGATVHLTVRILAQMPHVVLRTGQQGPSVAFFLRARGMAHRAPCTARAPRSRVGGKALAQGAQRTFYPTPPPSIVGRNRKIGGRRRARRGGLGGRCRAYTGGDAAGGATRRAAGSEHLIFPCGRVDGVRRARRSIPRGRNRRGRGKRMGRGGDDSPTYRASWGERPAFLAT